MYKDAIRKTFLISILATVLLSVIKFAAGAAGKSFALIYDAYESLADITLFSALYGATLLAEKPPDKEHQYGHTKFENLVALYMGMLILTGGIYLAYQSFFRLVSGKYSDTSSYTFVVAVSVVLIKEILYRYTLNKAEKTKSPVLKAAAADHRKDAASSLVTVAGTAGSFLKTPALDIIASFTTSLIIAFMGGSIVFSSSSELMDLSPSKEIMKKIEQAAKRVRGVDSISRIKARKSGRKIYVDIDIIVDGSLTVQESHNLASRVSEEIKKAIGEVEDVVVHVEPK